MAISYSCDGCGKAVENPVKVGHVIRRDYCDDCAQAANAFIESEETLRKDTHTRFVDDRAALIAKYSAGGFRLPDLPT